MTVSVHCAIPGARAGRGALWMRRSRCCTSGGSMGTHTTTTTIERNKRKDDTPPHRATLVGCGVMGMPNRIALSVGLLLYFRGIVYRSRRRSVNIAIENSPSRRFATRWGDSWLAILPRLGTHEEVYGRLIPQRQAITNYSYIVLLFVAFVNTQIVNSLTKGGRQGVSW